MMKSFIINVVLVLFTNSLIAQKGPEITFKAENNTIDYGIVYQTQDNGLRIFEFTNTGDAPLLIKNVESTCGCTVPSKPKHPIMPGQSDKIEVKYNMQLGPIRRTINVETNAINYENGIVQLKIRGEVQEQPQTHILAPRSVGPLQ